MLFTSGDLDRRIRIEQRVSVQDPVYGTREDRWETFADRWAQVRDVLPSRAESVSDGIEVSRRPARVRMRYLKGVTADMRVVLGGRVMKIIAGPAELGRREGIELMCEDYSTAGAGA